MELVKAFDSATVQSEVYGEGQYRFFDGQEVDFAASIIIMCIGHIVFENILSHVLF